MDCLENESVCSVKKENNLGYYRIHTVWNNNGFRVNVASRDGAWTGEMKPENVETFSKELKVDPDKYLAECKEVLTTDDGKKGYFYAVENGSFVWKKMIDEDSGMKVRMGSVMVQPVSFVDTIQNIIEVALNCKKNLNKELNTLKQEKDANLQRIHQLQEKLEELCDKKNIMESDLYSKFLLLLNSKKKKIQELEASLMKTVGKSEILSHSKNKMEEVSVVDPYDMDTEDESEDGCQGKKKQELLEEKSSHSTSHDVIADIDKPTKKCEDMAGSESDANSSDETPDLDIPSVSSSVVETSTTNVSSSDSMAVKEPNKSFPATKADILDFFFGPT